MSAIKLGVTLYSLSCEFQSRKCDLEDCLKAAAESGYIGIEMVASQTVPAYPYNTKEWMDYFIDLCQKYNLDPVCYGAYIDKGQRSDRDLTEEEIIQYTFNDLYYASYMGFKIVRTQYGISPELLEQMIPVAKKFGIWLAVEMHHPHSIETPIWKEYIKLFDRVGTEHIGLIPDLGIFINRPHYPYQIQALEMGVREEVYPELVKAHSSKKNYESAAATLADMELTEIEKTFLAEMYDLFTPADMDSLPELLKYSTYIHGKYYYIDENLEEDSIPYEALIKSLKDNNFEGYLIAEYEGHHLTDKIDAVEQIKRFSMMVNKNLQEGA